MSSKDTHPKPDHYKENPVYSLETDSLFLMVTEASLSVIFVLTYFKLHLY